ncbi:MAG TPA: hypothetical protein VGP41_09630 [Candidatus Lustribacter sp.]|jgi:hypothetical protein|nr:hypothetical protein [Candidatus Lustribacter sp.]
MALAALLATSVLATLLVVQTSLACGDKVALPVPSATMAMMPGMDMSSMAGPDGMTSMMICPVVLALLAASVLLAAATLAMWWRDPHRALTQRKIVRALAELPPARTMAGIALAGGCAVVAMLWLERSGTPELPNCILAIVLLAACSLCATLCAILAGRVALALGRRLMLAIAAVIDAVEGHSAPRYRRFAPVVVGSNDFPLLAAGRGLRAPPVFVR